MRGKQSRLDIQQLFPCVLIKNISLCEPRIVLYDNFFHIV